MPVRIAQHAAPGFRPHTRMALGHGAVVTDLEIIDPAAQEGEMIVAQPAQELAGFRQFFRRSIGARLGKVGDGFIHLRPHIGPVLDRDTHIVKRCSDALDQGAPGQIVQRRQMDLDHRFRQAAPAGIDPLARIRAPHLHDGVEHGQDVIALGTDLAHHAVDDKGPVAADDLQHVARQVGPVGALGGAHPHEDVLANTRLAKSPEIQAHRSQVGRSHLFEIFGERIVVDLGEEGRSRLPAFAAVLVVPARPRGLHEFRSGVRVRDADDRPHVGAPCGLLCLLTRA